MKQLFRISFCVLLFSVLLFACKKESEVIVPPDENPVVIVDPTPVEGTILMQIRIPLGFAYNPARSKIMSFSTLNDADSGVKSRVAHKKDEVSI